MTRILTHIQTSDSEAENRQMRIEMLKYCQQIQFGSAIIRCLQLALIGKREQKQVQVRDGMMTAAPCHRPPAGVTLAVVPASAPPVADGPRTIGAGTLQSEPECPLGRFPPTHHTRAANEFYNHGEGPC